MFCQFPRLRYYFENIIIEFSGGSPPRPPSSCTPINSPVCFINSSPYAVLLTEYLKKLSGGSPPRPPWFGTPVNSPRMFCQFAPSVCQFPRLCWGLRPQTPVGGSSPPQPLVRGSAPSNPRGATRPLNPHFFCLFCQFVWLHRGVPPRPPWVLARALGAKGLGLTTSTICTEGLAVICFINSFGYTGGYHPSPISL